MGNIIRNCVIRDFGKEWVSEEIGSLYGYGIYISGYDENYANNNYCTNTILKNNIVTNCMCNIYSTQADYTLIENNITSNAHLTGHGTLPADWQGHNGIQIHKSNYSTVIGNQANLNCEHGMYISESSNCAVKGNLSNSNRGVGIKLNTKQYLQ